MADKRWIERRDILFSEQVAIASFIPVVITTDLTVTDPNDVNTYAVKMGATTATTSLIFQENLDTNTVPQAITIRTFSGAGDILLANHGSNNMTVTWKYNNQDVDTLPGNGHFVYSLWLRPGTTDTYDIYGSPPVEGAVINHPASSFDSVGITSTDFATFPLQMNYDLTLPTFGNLFVVTHGTGGSAKVAFKGMTAGGIAMDEIFRSQLLDGSFTRCTQVWQLNKASAPGDGSILIQATEDGDTVSGNRIMIVFVIDNSDQVVPTLLSVTAPSTAQDSMRFYESNLANSSSVTLANQANKHMAISIMAIRDDSAPHSYDGTLIGVGESNNWNLIATYQIDENAAPSMDVTLNTNDYLEHLVFAIDEQIST